MRAWAISAIVIQLLGPPAATAFAPRLTSALGFAFALTFGGAGAERN